MLPDKSPHVAEVATSSAPAATSSQSERPVRTWRDVIMNDAEPMT